MSRESLTSPPPISFLHDIIQVEYTENQGAMLGLGSNLPVEARFLFLVVFDAVILLLALVFAIQTQKLNLVQFTGLSLITAGGLGNFLDRLLNDGAVIDFVSLGIGPIRSGVFNLADVFILSGIFIFLTSSFKKPGFSNNSAPD
jgi:signal peptidase II